jgi:hypothetical protein
MNIGALWELVNVLLFGMYPSLRTMKQAGFQVRIGVFLVHEG